ncbi:MAG: hypothetical protein ACHQXA_02405 [Gemmatimonadales bacterium]
MITKDQLAGSMLRECDICLHLHTKLTPAAADYRPSPDQRSTLELLRYLSICGIAGATCMAKSDWKLFAEFRERPATMSLAEFPAMMERQKKDLAVFFSALTDEQLRIQEAPMPGGGAALPLGAALMNGPLKWLTAYKMELFVYAKASGAHDIGTSNAWRGEDMKK